MSDSVRPHRRQPTRLPRPWDSPGKNTEVGCRFLLQCVKVKSESEVAQSCLTLSDPMDCSPPGSSVHGIFQARVLEWVAIAFSLYQIPKLFLCFFFWLYLVSQVRKSSFTYSASPLLYPVIIYYASKYIWSPFFSLFFHSSLSHPCFCLPGLLHKVLVSPLLFWFFLV